jgi:hypothetical protein
MKVTSVYYEKNFPTQEKFIFEKIGLTSTVEEGEDYRVVFEELKNEVHSMHHNSQPKQAESNTPEPIKKTIPSAGDAAWVPPRPLSKQEKEDKANQAIITEINNCTSEKMLSAYKLISANKPILKEAYDLKLSSLQTVTT